MLVDRRGQLSPHCSCVRVRGSYPEASSADVFDQSAGLSTSIQDVDLISWRSAQVRVPRAILFSVFWTVDRRK